jgi:hypothetical protein
MTVTRQYGYLALERVHGGLATMPNGEKRFFENPSEADQARVEWAAENALAEATRKQAEERQAFVEGCEVKEERVKQTGLLQPDIVHKRVLSPSGEYLGDPTQKEFTEIVEAAADEKFPEPTAAGLAFGLEGGVEKIVIWASSLFLDGERKRLPAFQSWSFGLPIEGVLEVLNEIAADGWYVVQVSEDRGLYAGTTNRTDSAVTTARYLLARDS